MYKMNKAKQEELEQVTGAAITKVYVRDGLYIAELKLYDESIVPVRIKPEFIERSRSLNMQTGRIS